MIDPNVAFAAVRASRDKVTRAESGGRALRAGSGSPTRRLPAARRSDVQLCALYPRQCRLALGGPTGSTPLTNLLVTPMSNQGIFDLYRQLAQKSCSYFIAQSTPKEIVN